MSLSEIKNKLYQTPKEGEETSSGATLQRDAKEKIDGVSLSPKVEKWSEPERGISEKTKKYLKISGWVLGGIILIAVSIWGILKYKASAFSESRLEVSLSGPQEVPSGQKTEWTVNIKNNNRASLKNAVLKVGFPENFKPEEQAGFKLEGATGVIMDLGEIPGNGEKKIIFSGSAYNPKGALIYLKASLAYYPSNFNSQFISERQLGVNVVSSPITLEITAPQNMVSSDAIAYEIKYRNLSDQSMTGVKVQMEYPEGFTFSKADQRPWEGNATWLIGDIEGQKEGKIVISGRLVGNRDEIKVAKATVGSLVGNTFIIFNQEETSTRIVASPLTIYQTVNEKKDLTVASGEPMRFEIFYKNESNIGLRDLIVTEKLEGEALDFKSLDLPGGAYDSASHTITWKASDFPVLKNLEPGKGGSIKFKIKVKENLPVNNRDNKNFVISSLAKVDSPDVPTPIEMNKIISGNQMDVKVNSKLLLSVQGFYTDSVLSNSGPIPPKVDQETTYTIHFKVGSVSNDLTDAKVEAVLPTGVVMLSEKKPDSAALSYNSRTNSIVWDIGSISAGTGVLDNSLEVAFKIKIKPFESLIGRDMSILGKPIFSAKDVFTGENLSLQGDGKNTNLLEDKTVAQKSSVVR